MNLLAQNSFCTQHAVACPVCHILWHILHIATMLQASSLCLMKRGVKGISRIQECYAMRPSLGVLHRSQSRSKLRSRIEVEEEGWIFESVAGVRMVYWIWNIWWYGVGISCHFCIGQHLTHSRFTFTITVNVKREWVREFTVSVYLWVLYVVWRERLWSICCYYYHSVLHSVASYNWTFVATVSTTLYEYSWRGVKTFFSEAVSLLPSLAVTEHWRQKHDETAPGGACGKRHLHVARLDGRYALLDWFSQA